MSFRLSLSLGLSLVLSLGLSLVWNLSASAGPPSFSSSSSSSSSSFASSSPSNTSSKPPISSTESPLYRQSLELLSGKKVDLNQYQDHVLLIVNTASRCGYTPQFEQMIQLKRQFSGQKFEVLAFPSNDFRQELSVKNEIEKRAAEFGETNFLMMAPTRVAGPEASEFFKSLKRQSSLVPQEILWNFEKFLVGPNGKVLGHFRSSVSPTDPKIISLIEKNLKK